MYLQETKSKDMSKESILQTEITEKKKSKLCLKIKNRVFQKLDSKENYWILINATNTLQFFKKMNEKWVIFSFW